MLHSVLTINPLRVKWRDLGIESEVKTSVWYIRWNMLMDCFHRYLAYYFPFLNWIRQYRWSYLQGDLIAAFTMASFYIPMSLSYASNLGHIPPINGLYSFVFNPLIYALLGSCPQMVVGPEAAGSLLVGTVVKSSVDRANGGDDDDAMNAAIAGTVTGMAGAVILIAGLTRLGFLDSVLSRPFLRGFISAIGFVILVDQLIPEMGLTSLAKHVGGVSHGSSIDKIIFLVTNARNAHGLTCGVAFGSFAIIMVCRYVLRSYHDFRRECANVSIKGIEETHSAKISIRGIRSRSFYSRRSLGGLHMEIRLGQARSADPGRCGTKYGITVSIQMAVPAFAYASRTRCNGYFFSDRPPWLLRVFSCSEESRRG